MESVQVGPCLGIGVITLNNSSQSPFMPSGHATKDEGGRFFAKSSRENKFPSYSIEDGTDGEEGIVCLFTFVEQWPNDCPNLGTHSCNVKCVHDNT